MAPLRPMLRHQRSSSANTGFEAGHARAAGQFDAYMQLIIAAPYLKSCLHAMEMSAMAYNISRQRRLDRCKIGIHTAGMTLRSLRFRNWRVPSLSIIQFGENVFCKQQIACRQILLQVLE